jgi:hypothetical protein
MLLIYGQSFSSLEMLASSLFGVLLVLSLMSTENGEKERRNCETKV